MNPRARHTSFLACALAASLVRCSGGFSTVPAAELADPRPPVTEDAEADVAADAGVDARPSTGDADGSSVDAELLEDVVRLDVAVNDATPDTDSSPDSAIPAVDAAPPSCVPMTTVPDVCENSLSAWTCPDAGPNAWSPPPGYGTLEMSCTAISGVWCCPCVEAPTQQSACADAAAIPTTPWSCIAGYGPGECNPAGALLFCCGEV